MNYEWVPLAAFIISIISICLTGFKYYLDWQQNRLNIELKPSNSYKSQGQNILEVSCTNKTKNPVAITNMTFYIQSQDVTLDTLLESRVISRNQQTGKEKSSSGLPINLNPYESKRVRIIIDGMSAMWVHDVKISTFTNKGVDTTHISAKTVPILDLRDLMLK